MEMLALLHSELRCQISSTLKLVGISALLRDASAEWMFADNGVSY